MYESPQDEGLSRKTEVAPMYVKKTRRMDPRHVVMATVMTALYTLLLLIG